MPNELVKQISYILYKADEEDVKVNALLKDESIWLTHCLIVPQIILGCILKMYLRTES